MSESAPFGHSHSSSSDGDTPKKSKRRQQIMVGATIALVILGILALRKRAASSAAASATPTTNAVPVDTTSGGGGGGYASSSDLSSLSNATQSALQGVTDSVTSATQTEQQDTAAIWSYLSTLPQASGSAPGTTGAAVPAGGTAQPVAVQQGKGPHNLLAGQVWVPSQMLNGKRYGGAYDVHKLPGGLKGVQNASGQSLNWVTNKGYQLAHPATHG